MIVAPAFKLRCLSPRFVKYIMFTLYRQTKTFYLLIIPRFLLPGAEQRKENEGFLCSPWHCKTRSQAY
jgi:hypothetical protein